LLLSSTPLRFKKCPIEKANAKGNPVAKVILQSTTRKISVSRDEREREHSYDYIFGGLLIVKMYDVFDTHQGSLWIEISPLL